MTRLVVAQLTVSFLVAFPGVRLPLHARVDQAIRGVVRGDDQRGLEGAEITTSISGERAVTDYQGAFLIVTSAKGPTVVLRAKAVGYAPDSQSVALPLSDTGTVSFTLKRVAQQLPSIVVQGESPGYTSAKMLAFEERRKAGLGRFVTREMLAQRENSVLTDVLRMTPGLSFVRRPDKCGGGFALASSRGGSSFERPEWMYCEGQPPVPFQMACYIAVYMDGARIWSPGQKEPPKIDDVASIVSLEAIEVYRGPSETPIAYQTTGNACGVILLWTRTGEKG